MTGISKKYKVMKINDAVFADCPIVSANTPSQAVFIAFKEKARRSGETVLDYMTEDIQTGRRCYLKIV